MDIVSWVHGVQVLVGFYNRYEMFTSSRSINVSCCSPPLQSLYRECSSSVTCMVVTFMRISNEIAKNEESSTLIVM